MEYLNIHEDFWILQCVLHIGYFIQKYIIVLNFLLNEKYGMYTVLMTL